MLAHSFRCRHDGQDAEADVRAGAEGNRRRSGRAAALLGFAWCADFETAKHHHQGRRPEPA